MTEIEIVVRLTVTLLDGEPCSVDDVMQSIDDDFAGLELEVADPSAQSPSFYRVDLMSTQAHGNGVTHDSMCY